MTKISNREHRTALFIDADALSGDYQERVERLLQSLNGPNIKVDLFSVSAPASTGGVVKIKSLADVTSSVAGGKATDAELSQAAKEAGYTQVLFTHPAGA